MSGKNAVLIFDFILNVAFCTCTRHTIKHRNITLSSQDADVGNFKDLRKIFPFERYLHPQKEEYLPFLFTLLLLNFTVSQGTSQRIILKIPDLKVLIKKYYFSFLLHRLTSKHFYSNNKPPSTQRKFL